MAKPDAVSVAPKLYKLLAPLSSDERAKAIQATLILFGEQTVSTGGGTKLNNPDPPKASMTFFEDKKPTNKGEILAVAARYREIYEKVDTHSKEEIKKVIADARRNFDSHNYMRD